MTPEERKLAKEYFTIDKLPQLQREMEICQMYMNSALPTLKEMLGGMAKERYEFLEIEKSLLSNSDIAADKEIPHNV